MTHSDLLKIANQAVNNQLIERNKELWDKAKEMFQVENTDPVTGKPIFESSSMVTPEQNERMHKAFGIASFEEYQAGRKES